MARRLVHAAGFAVLGAVGGAAAEEPAAPTYAVFFGFARETIDARGVDAVTSIARAFAQSGAGAVSIVGHADTVGDATVNQALSARRAALIRRELIVRGVPSAAIETAAFGETSLAVETGDGVREAANRRVEAAVLVPGARPAPDPLTPFSFPLPPAAETD